jgi:hypothetical protein
VEGPIGRLQALEETISTFRVRVKPACLQHALRDGPSGRPASEKMYFHVHLIVMVPPKWSISELMGRLKGRSAIRILRRFSELRKKRYWGNHFWAPGYCVDTVGLDAEMIRRYVRYQEKREKDIEQQQLKF